MPFNDKWWASALAVDVVCQNVYVYDEDEQKMYVIDMQNKHSGIIFSDLPGVKDIAINPFRRWIFMLTKSSVRKSFTTFIKYYMRNKIRRSLPNQHFNFIFFSFVHIILDKSALSSPLSKNKIMVAVTATQLLNQLVHKER